MSRTISKADIKNGKYIINPDWDKTKEAKEAKEKLIRAMEEFPWTTEDDMSNVFPEDYGKDLAEGGSWIQIQRPPCTEYTVPPFSIWFATGWPTDNRHPVKRVKIMTPDGELGILPAEYCIVKDITKWFGQEKEGVMMRQINLKPVCDEDKVHYMMSRGIRRKDALMLIIHEIKDMNFLWFEFAPQYGEYFGKEWPSPEKCSYALPRENWIADNEVPN